MNPKISCLMVTLGNREFLKRAVKYYCNQDYMNRELIIIFDGYNKDMNELSDFIAGYNRKDIYFEGFADRKYSLGELRNISRQKASGTIICQWDDDDIYHPTRLTEQYKCLIESKSKACFIGEFLQYIQEERILAHVDWTPNSVPYNNHPGTVMMYNDIDIKYPITGSKSKRSEDTFLLEKLVEYGHKITTLVGKEHIFVYVFHGNNTWSKNHHVAIMRSCGKRFIKISSSDILN